MIQGALRHALALLVLVAAGNSALATGNYPGNAARVNGVDISYQRYMGLYQEYQRSKGVAIAARGDQLPLLTRMRKEAMDMLIEQELIIQAAKARGIEVKPEEVDGAWADITEPFDTPGEFIRKLEMEGYTEDSYREHLKRMIAAKKYLDDIRMGVAEVSDEDLDKYYRDNEYRLTFPEQVRVRHILLTWKPMGTTDDKAAIRDQMKPILERARADEDFAKLAREFSDDYATKQNGGDTGLFKRGEMAPAFEQAAFALKPGEISDPVETPFGVHILRMEEHRQAYLLPLDEIREKLRDHVREERMEAAVEQEIDRLREQGKVEILIALERPKDKS